MHVAENDEIRFRRLLRQATTVVGLLAECRSVGKPVEISWDDFVSVAVEHLLTWADLETRAALSLLRDAAVAPAAEILLRGLLEALAHVSWIGSPPTPEERRCRALCYELGRAVSYGHGLRKMSPDAVSHLPADTKASLDDNIDTIRRLLREAGCKCSRRHEGNVESDLKGLAQALNAPYVYELWVTSSWVAHQFAFDRLARSNDVGVMTLAAPTAVDRAKLLTWVVAIFGYVGQAALLIENPGQVGRFNASVLRFLNSRALLAATTGATQPTGMSQSPTSPPSSLPGGAAAE